MLAFCLLVVAEDGLSMTTSCSLSQHFLEKQKDEVLKIGRIIGSQEKECILSALHLYYSTVQQCSSGLTRAAAKVTKALVPGDASKALGPRTLRISDKAS